MTATTHTIVVDGMTVRTRTARRFVAIAVRGEAVEAESGVYVAFIEIIGRSDAFTTAATRARRYGRIRGGRVVVVDTETGREYAGAEIGR